MDCRTCQPTLIDLVHGELATDAAAAARDHMRGCESCRGAFKRLQSGLQLAQELELLRPPQRVEARLLQLAEARAQDLATARLPAEPKAPSPLQALFEFVGRFAMGRQVGMATITLLIVGLGLWSLPQLSRSPTVTGHSVVNPDTSAEAAPSSGMQPAAPLDLKVDMRSGRIRSKEEQRALSQGQTPLPAAPPAPAADEWTAAPAAPQPDPARALDDIDAPLEEVAQGELGSAEKKAAESDRDQGDVAKRRRGPDAFPASTAHAANPNAEGLAASTTTSKGGRAPADPLAEFAAAPTEARRDAKMDDLSSRRAYKGGSGQGVASEPGSRDALAALPTPPPVPASAGASVRTKKSAAPCASLGARYAQLSEQAPNGAQAGQALLALARCKEQAGDFATARALLERATQNAAVAAQARQMLSPKSKSAPPAKSAATSTPVQEAPTQTAPALENSYRR